MKKIKDIILILVFYALGTFMPMGLLIFFLLSPFLVDFIEIDSIIYSLSFVIIFVPGILFNSIFLNRYFKLFTTRIILYISQALLLSTFLLFILFIPDSDTEINIVKSHAEYFISPFLTLLFAIIVGAYLGAKDLVYKVVVHCFKIKKLTN